MKVVEKGGETLLDFGSRGVDVGLESERAGSRSSSSTVSEEILR